MKKQKKVNKEDNEHPLLFHQWSIGQKAADIISRWAGSWTFIISFLVIFSLWISANVYGWINQWDPYPFILLNLALSLLAAIQAPVILMSQNRQAQKDRIRVEYDYTVNREAKKEIKLIHKQLTRIERMLNNK
jgi:uncharacterized membrane protein